MLSDSARPGRVTFTLAAGLVIAMMVARSVLPPALRALSRHASPELYQLTLIAFCLLCGWLSGFMVRGSVGASCTSAAACAAAFVRLHQLPLNASCLVSAGCMECGASLRGQVESAAFLP